MIITLTPGEITVLQDRLAVPDAIIDALDGMYADDLLEYRIKELAKNLKPYTLIELRGSEVDILRDCVEGSTWFANSDDWKPNQRATWERVAASLEQKLVVQMPRC